MAKFYLHNGVIGLRKNEQEEALAPIPATATGVTAFDETVAANAQIISDFDNGYSRFSYVSGQLRRDGVTVVFAADSQNKQDLDSLLAAAAQAVADNNTYLSLASPSNVQIAAQVRSLTQQINRIIKRLVLLGKK